MTEQYYLQTYLNCYAISLHQPFATLWALGGEMAKQYETRDWRPKAHDLPRRIVIHAAQLWDSEVQAICARKPVMDALWNYRNYLTLAYEAAQQRAAREGVKLKWGYVPFTHSWGVYLPRGCYIGGGIITICQPTETAQVSKRERLFGDYSANRYAWNLEQRKRLEYTRAKGHQKWWRVATDLQEASY